MQTVANLNVNHDGKNNHQVIFPEVLQRVTRLDRRNHHNFPFTSFAYYPKEKKTWYEIVHLA
jgi:hypothetical protein